METIISAFIGLVGIVLGALITAFAPELKRSIRRNASQQIERGSTLCPLELFGARASSDEPMIAEILLHDRVAFVGISHRNLSTYLKDIISRLANHQVLASLDIYYASNEDGRLWERERFITNVSETRQEIAELVRDPRWGAHKVGELHFWQARHHATYGGCIIGENSNSILYVVNYLPTHNPDAKDSLTFRIAIGRGSGECASEFAQRYISGYKFIRQKAVDLGFFSPSNWDLSAEEWRAFSSTCLAHQNSMRYLSRLASLTGEEKVIDIACGDGTTSRILLESIPKGQLTVLDASPRMLFSAKSLLPNFVRFSLQAVPPGEGGYLVDIFPPYDIAFIHLALPSVGDSSESLRKLAKWCSSILIAKGRLALAVHNTAVQVSEDQYDIGNDPLREAIRRYAETHRTITYRPRQQVILDPQIIEAAFVESGFSVLTTEEMFFDMSMDDRVAMWSTPAVLDSLVDAASITFENRMQMMEFVRGSVRDAHTAPMIVKYWVLESS